MPGLVTLVVIAMLALSGCGAGESDAPEAAASPGAASSEARGTGSASPTPTESPTPSYRLFDQAALTKVLLPLSDAPPGYSIDASAAESQNKYFCDYKPPFEEKLRVRRDFQKGGGLQAQIASVIIRQFDTPQEAQAAFAALERTIAECKTDTLDGEKLTYAQVNMAQVGERTVGVRIEGPAFLVQGFALVGPSIISGGTGGLLSADADLQAELLEKQVGRYEEKAQA